MTKQIDLYRTIMQTKRSIIYSGAHYS